MQIGNPAIQVPCEVSANTFYFQPFWQRSHLLALLTGSNTSLEITAPSSFILFPAWLPSFCCPLSQQSLSVSLRVNGVMLACEIEFEPNGDVKIYNPAGWETGQQVKMESQLAVCLQLQEL